jgi:hypothetical protein
MSQPIAKNQFGWGGGKGDYERPVNRSVFRENIEKINKASRGKTFGTPANKKGGRTTYKYS